jgi:hypothetical protein
MKNNEIIMYDSPESAQYVTDISGWVSSTGHFFGKSEDSARYDGCTHRACTSCGKPTTKLWLICSDCRSTKEIERYYALDGFSETQWKEYWESKYPNEFQDVYYSDAIDHYFFTFEEVWTHCDDNDCSMNSLRLKWCEPEYIKDVDPDLYFQDIIQDGDDIPHELIYAFDQLNKKISEFNSKNILCYYPSKFRVII